MCAAAQITQAVQPLDGQPQAGEQPSDQQAVRVMMADMSESVAVLGVIKPLILDLPTAFGSERQPQPHRAGQEHLAPIAHDLMVRITVGTTERATRASAPSDGGSIHGKADATAGFESLVALGLAQDARQGGPRESGI